MAEYDVWIRSCQETNDRGLRVEYIRPTTWQKDSVELSSEQRNNLRLSLNDLGIQITTIEGLEGCIFRIDSERWTVREFVGNTRLGIIPDMFEPYDNREALGGRSVAFYAGDYLWETRWGHTVMVERKQLQNGELLHCLMSKKGQVEAKLVRQAKKLANCSDIRVLLIELGDFEVDDQTGIIKLPRVSRLKTNEYKTSWRWPSLQKALMHLCDAWGLRVWYTHRKRDTIDDLLSLRDDFDLHPEAHRSLRTVGVQTARVGKQYSVPVKVLCGIPGISPETASGLLDRYGTIKDIGNLSTTELMAMPGIGNVRASAIYDALNEKG